MPAVASTRPVQWRVRRPAALPVAGNVFILAQHYRVAPQRVSTAILLSTAASVLTVTAVIALISQGGYT